MLGLELVRISFALWRVERSISLKMHQRKEYFKDSGDLG